MKYKKSIAVCSQTTHLAKNGRLVGTGNLGPVLYKVLLVKRTELVNFILIDKFNAFFMRVDSLLLK